MNWTVLQGLSPEIAFEDYRSIALYLVRLLQIDKLFHGPTDPKISKKKTTSFQIMREELAMASIWYHRFFP